MGEVTTVELRKMAGPNRLAFLNCDMDLKNYLDLLNKHWFAVEYCWIKES